MPDFTGTNATEILSASETSDTVAALGGSDQVNALGAEHCRGVGGRWRQRASESNASWEKRHTLPTACTLETVSRSMPLFTFAQV
jgi:hypothetical protein